MASARHDLRCGSCGYVYHDVAIQMTLGARGYCLTHECRRLLYGTEGWDGAVCGGVLEPVPAIRLSLFSDADPRSSPHDFTKFTTQVETPGGGFRDVTVSSLRDIRRVEQESEQAEREGWGRRMTWRDYSQDVSNRDVHTIAPDPSLRPAKTFTNGTPVIARRGDPVTADHGTLPEE